MRSRYSIDPWRQVLKEAKIFGNHIGSMMWDAFVATHARDREQETADREQNRT